MCPYSDTVKQDIISIHIDNNYLSMNSMEINRWCYKLKLMEIITS